MNKIELTTFGKVPAALYLSFILNERQDKVLLRKVSYTIVQVRELLHEITYSHLMTDELSTSSFRKLLSIIENDLPNRTKKIHHQFVEQLVLNILKGEIKQLKHRGIAASKEQREINRKTPSGKTIPEVKAYVLQNEADRIEMLQERSRQYLASKGKKNTLY